MTSPNGTKVTPVQRRIAEVGAYFIHGLQTGMITPADVMSAFDDDAQPWHFFAEPDMSIIAHLIRNNGIGDPVTYLNNFGEAGRRRIEDINRTVMDVYIDAVKCVEWAAIIQDNWQQRQGYILLRQALDDLPKEGADAAQILQAASGKLLQVAQRVRNGNLIGSEIEQQGLKGLDDMTGVEKDSYILTGVAQIDTQYGGLERSKLTTLGGLWGSGKTALAAQMSYVMAEHGEVGLWIQTEMEAKELIIREAQRRGRIKRSDLTYLHNKLRDARTQLKRGSLSAEQAEAVQRQLEAMEKSVRQNESYIAIRAQLPKLAALPVRYCTTPHLNALQIQAAMQSVKNEFGKIDWLIVDHVEYLTPLHKAGDSEKVKQIYADFKIVMREFPDTAFLFLQHLNKEIFNAVKTSQDVVPSASNFNYGGTGALDTGWILTRRSQHMQQLNITPEMMAEKTPEQRLAFEREAKLWIVKSRSGKSNVFVPLEFWGEYFDFRTPPL